MATTSRGWRKLADNENDKAQAVNDALDDASADLTALAAALQTQIGDIDSTGGGGAIFRAVDVPANRFEWTDTTVVLGPGSAVAVKSTGKIAFNTNSGSVFYGADEQGGAPLILALVPDGTMPVDGEDVTGQVDYLYTRTFANETSDTLRLIAKVRDVGGNSDNQGILKLTMAFFADKDRAFALTGHVHQQKHVINLEADLNAIRARLTAGGL